MIKKRNSHKPFSFCFLKQRNVCIWVLCNVRQYHHQTQYNESSFLFLVNGLLSFKQWFMSARSYYFMATTSPKGLVTFCISLVEVEKRRPRHSLKALVQKWYTSLLLTLHWLELSYMVASNSKRSWKIIFQL